MIPWYNLGFSGHFGQWNGNGMLAVDTDHNVVNAIGQQTGGFAESLRWTIEALEGTAAVTAKTGDWRQ